MDSLENSQFSFYLSDDVSGNYNSLIFGGYDLKYAKQGSTDEDIAWTDVYGNYDSWYVKLEE